MAHKNKVSFLQITDYEIEKEKPNGSQMAHGKRVTLVSLSFFMSVGQMKPNED